MSNALRNAKAAVAAQMMDSIVEEKVKPLAVGILVAISVGFVPLDAHAQNYNPATAAAINGVMGAVSAAVMNHTRNPAAAGQVVSAINSAAGSVAYGQNINYGQVGANLGGAAGAMTNKNSPYIASAIGAAAGGYVADVTLGAKQRENGALAREQQNRMNAPPAPYPQQGPVVYQGGNLQQVNGVWLRPSGTAPLAGAYKQGMDGSFSTLSASYLALDTAIGESLNAEPLNGNAGAVARSRAAANLTQSQNTYRADLNDYLRIRNLSAERGFDVSAYDAQIGSRMVEPQAPSSSYNYNANAGRRLTHANY